MGERRRREAAADLREQGGSRVASRWQQGREEDQRLAVAWCGGILIVSVVLSGVLLRRRAACSAH